MLSDILQISSTHSWSTELCLSVSQCSVMGGTWSVLIQRWVVFCLKTPPFFSGVGRVFPRELVLSNFFVLLTLVRKHTFRVRVVSLMLQYHKGQSHSSSPPFFRLLYTDVYSNLSAIVLQENTRGEFEDVPIHIQPSVRLSEVSPDRVWLHLNSLLSANDFRNMKIAIWSSNWSGSQLLYCPQSPSFYLVQYSVRLLLKEEPADMSINSERTKSCW